MTRAKIDWPSPVGRARWTRLIPVAILVYIISFMDRTNIGFALFGLQKDLHINSTQQGLAAGIFFIGYLTLQIPGGHLAERWSAKKFVGIMIFVWGILAVLTGFVETYWQLLLVRFLLGVAEAGIWPAILVPAGAHPRNATTSSGRWPPTTLDSRRSTEACAPWSPTAWSGG